MAVARRTALRRLSATLERARRGQVGMLGECLAAVIKGYEVARQPNVARVCLRELARMNQDRRAREALLHHRRHLSAVDEGHNDSLAAALREQEGALKARLHDERVVGAMVEMLEKEAVAAELHDDTTGEHCDRVGRLASLLARC